MQQTNEQQQFQATQQQQNLSQVAQQRQPQPHHPQQERSSSNRPIKQQQNTPTQHTNNQPTQVLTSAATNQTPSGSQKIKLIRTRGSTTNQSQPAPQPQHQNLSQNNQHSQHRQEANNSVQTKKPNLSIQSPMAKTNIATGVGQGFFTSQNAATAGGPVLTSPQHQSSTSQGPGKQIKGSQISATTTHAQQRQFNFSQKQKLQIQIDPNQYQYAMGNLNPTSVPNHQLQAMIPSPVNSVTSAQQQQQLYHSHHQQNANLAHASRSQHNRTTGHNIEDPNCNPNNKPSTSLNSAKKTNQTKRTIKLPSNSSQTRQQQTHVTSQTPNQAQQLKIFKRQRMTVQSTVNRQPNSHQQNIHEETKKLALELSQQQQHQQITQPNCSQLHGNLLVDQQQQQQQQLVGGVGNGGNGLKQTQRPLTGNPAKRSQPINSVVGGPNVSNNNGQGGVQPSTRMSSGQILQQQSALSQTRQQVSVSVHSYQKVTSSSLSGKHPPSLKNKSQIKTANQIRADNNSFTAGMLHQQNQNHQVQNQHLQQQNNAQPHLSTARQQRNATQQQHSSNPPPAAHYTMKNNFLVSPNNGSQLQQQQNGQNQQSFQEDANCNLRTSQRKPITLTQRTISKGLIQQPSGHHHQKPANILTPTAASQQASNQLGNNNHHDLTKIYPHTTTGQSSQPIKFSQIKFGQQNNTTNNNNSQQQSDVLYQQQQLLQQNRNNNGSQQMQAIQQQPQQQQQRTVQQSTQFLQTLQKNKDKHTALIHQQVQQQPPQQKQQVASNKTVTKSNFTSSTMVSMGVDGATNQTTQQLEMPLTPARVLKQFSSHLTEYEQTEILDYPQVFYFGKGIKKVKPIMSTETKNGQNSHRSANSQNDEDSNFGFDDSKGNLKITLKDHIAFRYEILSFLGKGSFGIAVKAYDHKRQEEVALKIIKNKKKYYYQAGVELKILQYLRENDQEDTMNIIHMKDYVVFRKHLCIGFELMSINLYEFLKLNDFQGLSLGLIRRFAIQLLYSLKYLKDHEVIHCDLKPENILLKDPAKSGIKVIDFGSSCFQNERVYTYIQSRFYRAPEIILGIPYTPAIDMWSFGCIMAEFAMGYPIFPGEDESDQLSLMMEVLGIPMQKVLEESQRKMKFFDDHGMPKLVNNKDGAVRKPGTKVLEDVLELQNEPSFVDFIERCLDWDPRTRLTPEDAIKHQWILEGLPPKVLIHHQKLHAIPTRELPSHIREQRAEYLEECDEDMQAEFRETPYDLSIQAEGLETNQSQSNNANNNNNNNFDSHHLSYSAAVDVE